ncbi:AAA family ATPase [Rathayibacter sp. Leaf248]|uniref:AAA family ATPase n=1 Tax=Rathayibacter sp. Leaf248 TaxID=2876555 RepID=UPI001E643132|nr:AAA family ATPase [Rathayibacter sp. Leaf248]
MSGEESVQLAERAVIGALLLNGKVMREVTPLVAPGDFLDPHLGELLRGMKRLLAEGRPVDVITVAGRLQDWGVTAYTPADLHELAGEVPTATNASWYAAQVREASVRRQLLALGQNIQQAAGRTDSGVTLAKAAEGLKAIRSGAARSRALAVQLEAVMQGVDDYDWVVPDLLERGDRLVLTGVEGGGKSMLIRQIVLLAAAGIHPFTFAPITPVRGLVIDAENTEKQWRRSSRRLVQAASLRSTENPAAKVRLWCTSRLDLTKDSDLSEVHSLIDEHQPDVLAIGPLYRLVPRAITSDDDAAPLLAALDTIRDRGVALLMEAHAGHTTSGATGDRELRPRGSAALLGWPEFGLGITPQKVQGRVSGSNFKLVRWRGDRDARDWPSHISRGASPFPWTPTQNGARS